jgi:hypothetical protein
MLSFYIVASCISSTYFINLSEDDSQASFFFLTYNSPQLAMALLNALETGVLSTVWVCFIHHIYSHFQSLEEFGQNSQVKIFSGVGSVLLFSSSACTVPFEVNRVLKDNYSL